MGKRKILTQKEINAIFGSKGKNAPAYVVFFTLSISLLVFSIACFCIHILMPLGVGLLVFSVIFGTVAIVLFFKQEMSENSSKEQPITTQSSSVQTKPIEKPWYDFFTDDAKVDTVFLQKLINSQKAVVQPYVAPYDGYEKEDVIDVSFNVETRVAKVTFESCKYYRTIERYVQQNYQRTPVYSSLKCKSKEYTKSYKLTNKNLEEFHHEFGSYNNHLYMNIICGIDNPHLVPLAFFKKALEKQYYIWLSYCNEEIRLAKNKYKNFESSVLYQIETLNNNITLLNKQLNSAESKLNKLQNKLSKFEKKGKINAKINAKNQSANENVSNIKEQILKFENEIKSLKLKNENQNKERENTISSFNEKKATIEKVYASIVNEYQGLPKQVENNDNFTFLFNLAGMEYEKIIGCYVIRNKENGRCYVGQSKDVIKRLKQHFKGTVPSNITFAEDYYSTQERNREKLFEYKIFPCQTKDELDMKEKALIEEYEAFTKGYNGTHGNS